MATLLNSLQDTLGKTLPSLVGSLAILLVGWFVALAIRAAIRRGLGVLRLNERLRASAESSMDVEGGTAAAAYYLVLLVVLLAFFNTLDLALVSSPLEALVGRVFAFVPKLVAAAVLLLIAWVLAMIVRGIVTKALAATTFDEKLSAGAGMRPISDSAGHVLYWLIFLLFLPAILGTLQLEGLLQPVQDMVRQILAMLPNIFAAGIIGVVGWWVAKIVRELSVNLLATAGVDRLGDRVGLQGTLTLSGLIGLVFYILILVPALIAALQALQIEAISAPATRMLGQLMAAIPNIFAAAIILAVAFFLAQLVSTLASGLLGGMGFDVLPAKLGLGRAFETGATASVLAGRVIAFFIMLFATVEAANRLGFEQVSRLVSMFIKFGSDVLLGVAIIAVGFWLATLAYDAILRIHGDGARTVAGVARFALLGLILAMGLRAMGLADDIVNLAFGLTLGSVAVAVALSFGLGGREAAGRQMEYWLRRLRGEP